MSFNIKKYYKNDKKNKKNTLFINRRSKMLTKNIFLCIIIFVGCFTITNTQACNSNTYTITDNNNNTLLSLDTDGSLNISGICNCKSFSGDGSNLKGLENQHIIANLIALINNLTIQINMIMNNVTRLQNTVNNQISQINLLQNSVNNSVPVGTITSYGSINLPMGWMNCNGSAISRTLYSDLFNVIGVTYGVGDSVNTFNLPDMRGKTAGTGIGLTNRNIGEIIAKENHTLNINEIPSHNHSGSIIGTDGRHTHSIYGFDGQGHYPMYSQDGGGYFARTSIELPNTNGNGNSSWLAVNNQKCSSYS